VSSYRPEKIAEQILRELSQLLIFDIKDPRVATVTITDVQVARDLSSAKVFFTVTNEADDRKAAEQGLKKSAPYLRRQLSQVMRMRSVPDLRFFYDESIGYGQKIEALLRQVKDDLHDPSENSSTDSE